MVVVMCVCFISLWKGKGEFYFFYVKCQLITSMPILSTTTNNKSHSMDKTTISMPTCWGTVIYITQREKGCCVCVYERLCVCAICTRQTNSNRAQECVYADSTISHFVFF